MSYSECTWNTVYNIFLYLRRLRHACSMIPSSFSIFVMIENSMQRSETNSWQVATLIICLQKQSGRYQIGRATLSWITFTYIVRRTSNSRAKILSQYQRLHAGIQQLFIFALITIRSYCFSSTALTFTVSILNLTWGAGRVELADIWCS